MHRPRICSHVFHRENDIERESHRHANATREDCTITIDKYQELPPFIIGIKLRCDEHCEKYQTYCNDHEILYCRKCVITGHKKCKNKVPLEEVVDNVMNSSDAQEMENLINELTKNIGIIIASGQDNLLRLIETKNGIVAEINEIQHDINDHLDRLRNELLTILDEKSDSAKSEITKSVTTLEKKKKEIRKCQGNLQNINQQATDPQTSVALKQIEAAITKNELFVQSLIDDENVYKLMLDFEIHQKLKSLTTDVHRYGEVTISMIPCDFTEISKPVGQCNKCGSSKCMTCPIIQCTRQFRSTFTKQNFIIHGTATCKTANIIYLLECGICSFQYTGETKQPLNVRMSEHRSRARSNNTFPLCRHLNSTGHHTNFDELKVTIIEHDPNWEDTTREDREHFWISKLKTLRPYGINMHK